jgi:hypothetical protein
MRYKIIIIVLYVLFTDSSTSYGREWISTQDTIVLKGEISIHHYYSQKKELEKVFLLTLKKSINVKKDKYGDQVKNVKVIQLFFGDNILYPGVFNEKVELENSYIKKTVTVTGILSHAITSHHFKKIIMQVININKN